MSPATSAAIAAIAAAVSALAVIATAWIATRALRAARQDSRERTRPVVVAELRRAALTQGSLDLVVRNYGLSPARDVSVDFMPRLPPAETLPTSDMRHWLALRYARPIEVIPPGASLSNVYRAGRDDVDPVIVELNYSASDGVAYQDHFLLDPEVHLTETSSGPSDTNDRGLRLIRAIEALVRATRER